MTLYKFLRLNKKQIKSNSGDVKWELGKWKKFRGELEMCRQGFHCSVEPFDAFSFVQGEILAEVEVKGNHLEYEDKQVWQEMRIVKTWGWGQKDSVKLAIFSAEQVLDIYEEKYPQDKRPRQAILAAKRYSKSPTKKNADAAAHAAYAATRAAYAADAADAADAAYAAAGAADAAYAAARAADAATCATAAARVAYDAAYTAARAAARVADAVVNKKIQKYFKKLVKDLKPYQKREWVK